MIKKASIKSAKYTAIILTCSMMFHCLKTGSEEGESNGNDEVEISDSTMEDLQAMDSAISQFEQDLEEAEYDSYKADELQNLYDEVAARFTDDDVSTLVEEWENLNQALEDGTSYSASSGFDSLVEKLSDLEYFSALSGDSYYYRYRNTPDIWISVARMNIVLSQMGYPGCDESCLMYMIQGALVDLDLSALLLAIPYVGSAVSLFLSSYEAGDLLAHCFPPADEECTWDRFIQALISWGVDAGSVAVEFAGLAALKSMFKVMVIIKSIGGIAADGYRYLDGCEQHKQQECYGGDNGDGDTDGEFTEDPFEDYDCYGTDSSDVCTEVICNIKESVYDPLRQSCESNWTEQCDSLVRCIKDYISCIHTWDCDSQYIGSCANDYTYCIEGM